MLDKKNTQSDMEHDPSAGANRGPSDSENNENAMNVDEDVEEEEPEDVFENYENDEFVEDDFGPQEFSALNNQLDQLQTALDSLESRNDDIHFKLLELLRSSREIRQNMSEENSKKREGAAAVAAGSDANPSSSSASLEEGNSTSTGSSRFTRNDSTSSSGAGTSSSNSIGKDMPKAE